MTTKDVRAPLVIAAVVLGLSSSVQLALGASDVKPVPIDDAHLQATTTTMGGASVLPTTRTVQHWFGSTTNPDNGITYGYNMVGADPNHCSAPRVR